MRGLYPLPRILIVGSAGLAVYHANSRFSLSRDRISRDRSDRRVLLPYLSLGGVISVK